MKKASHEIFKRRGVPASKAYFDVPLGKLDELLINRYDLQTDLRLPKVWPVERQERFVGSLVEGVYNHPIIIAKPVPTGVWEIVDGTQRIQAVRRFLAGQIDLEFSDGEVVQSKDIFDDETAVAILEKEVTLPVLSLTALSIPEIVAVFIAVNALEGFDLDDARDMLNEHKDSHDSSNDWSDGDE